MEAIATEFAVDAATSLIKMAASKAFEEIRLIWGFNDDLARLKKKLSYIEALMEDLGKRKREEKRDLVNRWLQDVKEVACSAENLVNDHAYEMLRRKLAFINNSNNRRPSFKKKWRSYIREPSRSPIALRVRMTHRVKEILSMFDELYNTAKEIGLSPAKLSKEAVSTPAPPSAADKKDTLSDSRESPLTPVFIGRVDDKNKLLQMLRSPTPTANQAILPIVAIVGLGGLGKTTLALQLFDHVENGGPFEGQKVWICVSEDFDVMRLLKEMVQKVTKSPCQLTNKDAIIDTLQEKLKGKKLFLVLDDVWNDKHMDWDPLKSQLQRINVATGSVILITTRNKNVATAAGVGVSQSHELQGLSDNEALDLLKRQFPENSYFNEAAAIKIINKCAGVPLAIKVIGGILKSKNQYEWHQIENSEEWNIPQDVNSAIMPYLLLSYNHFDDVSLKQCFACCAIYPKDTKMEKGELIALWSAQGLLDHDQDKSNNTSFTTMETIGEKYIDILVNHSFLLLEDEDYRTKYKMHDLVHDLATHVLKKDLLVWEVGTNLNDVSHVRHLAVNFKDNDEGAPETVTLPEKEIRKLRTVIFWNYGVSMWKSLNGARYLCTLIMVDIGLEEVPPVIGQLVHLRYLDLTHNYKLKSLPDSICNLYQLQTLRLLWCDELEELPRELQKLKNLRHILITKALLASKGLQELTNLQTLPPLELRAEEGWKIDELGPLNQLKGEIRIHGLAHVKNKEEATKAGLERKDKILHLSLEWPENFREENIGSSNDEVVLEGLEPHPNIQSLSVDEYKGVKFPEWIMKMSVKQLQTGYLTHLSSLTKVELLWCNNCQQLPSLGQLPNLKVLELRKFDKVECIGDEFYKSSNNNCREHPSARDEDIIFPSLKTLRIARFERLTTWAAPSSALAAATAFPTLETLKVENCPQVETTLYVQTTSLKFVEFDNVGGTPLDMVKGSNGLIELKLGKIQKLRMLPEELSNCSNLQSLEIIDCENLECIPNGLTSLKTLYVDRCPSLSSIPVALSSLRNLYISDCQSLASILPNDVEDCMSLEDLSILDCPRIVGPILDIGKLQGLKVLRLNDAGEQQLWSSWSQGIPHLVFLEIWDYREEWDISLISSLTSLTSLELRNCPNFKAITTQQQALPHLPLIGMEGDVPDLSQLKRLKDLFLFNAGEMMMTSAARSIPQLDSLRELEIGGFKDEEEITKFVSQIKSTPHSHSLPLRKVTLEGWLKIKKMPEQLQHLLPSSTLQTLRIREFDELEQLPDWIGNLSSLKVLVLSGCNKLKYLPSKQAMMHLSGLHIIDCPQLKERCEKHSNNENENDNDNGPPHSESQWPNIEHIPFIDIDGETIRNPILGHLKNSSTSTNPPTIRNKPSFWFTSC